MSNIETVKAVYEAFGRGGQAQERSACLISRSVIPAPVTATPPLPG